MEECKIPATKTWRNLRHFPRHFTCSAATLSLQLIIHHFFHLAGTLTNLTPVNKFMN